MRLRTRHIKKWFFTIVVCLLHVSLVLAQDLKFKHFSREEGLSSINAKTIFQDSNDFIWIGTQDGLNRYDGYHFKVFKSNINDPKSLVSGDINCITEDADGSLYIGTNGSGLSVYDRVTETFKNYNHEKNNICNDNILCLLNLNDVELLIGTENGLCVFNKKTKRAIKVSSPINALNSQLYISALYSYHKGTVWVAIPKYGLYEFQVAEKKLIQHPFPESIVKHEKQYQDHAIMSITQAKDHLYCATFSGGIITYNLITNTFQERIDFSKINPELNAMRNIMADENFLYAATLGGFIKYNLATQHYKIFTHNITDNTSIPSNIVLCLMQDKQHNIWLGTDDKGICVNFKSSQNFTHYNKHQLKGNDMVYCFLESQDGLIWIGTDNGLYTFNRKNKEFKNRSEIIQNYHISTVLSLAEDHRKNILIGTYNGGVIEYNPTLNTSKKILPAHFQKDNVHKIIQDSKNQLLIATYQYGLLKINPENEQLEVFDMKAGLNTKIIKDVYEDKKNRSYWLSTQDGGLNVLAFDSATKKPRVKIYNHQATTNSISSNLVYSVYESDDNTLWIATNNGLNRLKNNTFIALTEENGLASNCIYNILPDDDKRLWLTTNNGLSCYNPKTNAFTNYNTSNGIQAKEFNQGAAYKCKDGSMLVGGINGFNYFNPKNIKPTVYQPKLYIYSYTKQGKETVTDTSILLKKHLSLNYKDNYFTLEAIALDYTSPENIKYKYKLEGYDQNWSEPTSMRYISYTELPGGHYTLRVTATNSDGIWSAPLEMGITVIPPWYKTKWFYTIAIIVISGSVYGFFRYRTAAIKKENKQLEHKVAERTQELTQKNRDITSSIEYAKRIQEAILPAKDVIFSKLNETFIFYQPKDIVSGDFYWFGEKGTYKIIAVVDCTGHGVPGAFMSMIGHNLLNQIIAEKGNYDPGIILQELHKGVQAALKQGHNAITTSDGMDVSIISIDTTSNTCLWAGAFRNLVIVGPNGKLEKIEGNKYPIGGAQFDEKRIFRTHILSLQKNDMLYLFSDGYADQFGGEHGKKFMVKRFHQTLLEIHQLSVQEQCFVLEQQFRSWMGNQEQVDDVLVIGVRL